jgi:hypothetical protein
VRRYTSIKGYGIVNLASVRSQSATKEIAGGMAVIALAGKKGRFGFHNVGIDIG